MTMWSTSMREFLQAQIELGRLAALVLKEGTASTENLVRWMDQRQEVVLAEQNADRARLDWLRTIPPEELPPHLLRELNDNRSLH